MLSNQMKRARAGHQLKVLYLWLQALVGSILFFGLTISAGALFFFAWLADEVLEGDTKAFDEFIRVFVHGFANESITALMNFVTILGSTLFLSIVFLCTLVIFIHRSWKRAAALLTMTMAGAIILNFVLKVSFARARPLPFFDTPLPDSYSFPSGHALFAACFYGVLARLFAARITNRALQASVCSSAVLLVFLIGLSRVYLGVHYPSDVIAGYAAAIVWISTVMLADQYLKIPANLSKNKF